MRINRAAAAVGVLALAGALLAAGPAQAAGAPKGDGAKAVCKRLPKTQERVDKALARLNGDAGVVGSVARLQQRVDNAHKAGHAEIEKYLNDRLTFRRSLLPTLQTRKADLGQVADWCAKNAPAAAK
ncbi:MULTISPECIES: hypothetical protein [Kitasatospora]|uniref:Haemophore haem-binding domain-containing protein n=1 Tax=Kitasatospora setae (strain ATCC 33774 / DSM 43861 / JCM 3304 / KCC A-0304 / NBRC 14216 / KM-6054) TaxID=452652 RepID=E4N1D0_KITSK|nr:MULTISPECIES: hypothetical protein [Kitasatospora]BAJ31964.1 hypothetical protein KSE_61990 [Kitasatospora setae KM-6054]